MFIKNYPQLVRLIITLIIQTQFIKYLLQHYTIIHTPSLIHRLYPDGIKQNHLKLFEIFTKFITFIDGNF